MTLELHPNARSNYDLRAEELLKKLVIYDDNSSHVAFNSELYAPTISEADIIGGIELTQPICDENGVEIGRFFYFGQRYIGLIEPDFTSAIKIAECIQKTPSFRDSVSQNLLVVLVFSWFRLRISTTASISLTEYILSECDKKITDCEVWLPITYLAIETEFKIGRITFKPVTKAILDDVESKHLSQVAQNDHKYIREYMHRLRSQMQGKAVATIHLVAEDERRYEIAREESENALKIIRFYSPKPWLLDWESEVTLFGTQNDQRVTMYSAIGGLLLESSRTLGGGRFMHTIRLNQLEAMRRDGLDVLNGLMIKDNPNQFEKSVLSAIFLFADSPRATTFSDKLLPALIAIESLFLKDSQEPIKAGLGDRLALLTQSTIETRQSVKNNVNLIYDIRSGFIHHGHTISIEHRRILTEFLRTAWHALFIVVTRCVGKYSTTQEFVKDIDLLKFSGGTLS